MPPRLLAPAVDVAQRVGDSDQLLSLLVTADDSPTCLHWRKRLANQLAHQRKRDVAGRTYTGRIGTRGWCLRQLLVFRIRDGRGRNPPVPALPCHEPNASAPGQTIDQV